MSTRGVADGGGKTYLVGEDECTEEHALARPLFEGDLEVRLGPVDIDKGHEEGRDLHFRLVDDVGHKRRELGVLRVT